MKKIVMRASDLNRGQSRLLIGSLFVICAMAALTTILGMAPLLMDAFFKDMAITIMFGLGFATVLTLVALFAAPYLATHALNAPELAFALRLGAALIDIVLHIIVVATQIGARRTLGQADDIVPARGL